MSHNYQYRGQPLDSSLRSDPGSYSSSGRPHTLPDYDFTRAPQESHQSLSSPSTNVSRSSQESAFSVLSSCGLEPSDLALLAEMPEDALTVESLPHVLRQIKGKRGTVKPYLQGSPSPSSSSSSCAPSSTHRPATSPSTSHWDHPRSHTLQYSTDQVEPSPPSSELDRWGNPITLSCAKAQPCSSSSPSSYVVDFHHRSNLSMYGKTCRDPSPVSSQNYFHNSGTPDFVKPGRSSHQVPSQDFHHRPGTSKFGETSRNAAPASTENYYYRPGPPEYGNTGRDVGPSSSQNQPSFSSAGRDQTTHPSLSSQPGQAVYMLPPPAQESHHGPSFGGSRSETSSTRSSSSTQSAASLPSRQDALDFHGVTPPFYPHSCSLCAITVMSEKVWLKHINGPHHADGQLNLLQKYPSWDCRMETVERANNQPGQRKEEENAVKTQTANQSPNPLQPNTKTQKKISEKSKVVCVKFPAHAVDEAYLRKLAEPFGKVIKIIMFPSLAFVELGSIDQARDLVKFHTNYPPTVNGALMEFRISDTFNFLQSSSVVSFFPTPSGEDSKSDLISIIKRFGSPLYTLFLPSRAFVEMKDAATAQKIVNYYSSNNLRINDDVIKVSFSGEYKSLMRIPSAKRYREETTTTSKTTERMRRRSRTRSRSSSREKSPKERKSRTRSKSKEKPDKNRKSKSRERSSHERRTRSREKASRVSSRSGDRSSRDEKTRTRSKSKEKITNERKSVSMTSTVSTESSSDPHPVRDTPEAAEKEHVPEEAESSDDESDIEGMEVIGEDGENVQDDEMETADEAGDDEEEKKEHPAERKHSPGGDKEEMKDEEASHHEQPEEDKEKEEEKISVKEEKNTNSAGETEGEPDFPFNLDSCITLDELKEDDSDDPDEDSRYERKPLSRRVLYFKNVPVDVFTDAEFIQLVRGYGTAKLFLRVPGRQTGFIEMSSSAEAQRVKDALTAQPLCVNNCRVFVQISSNYPRLFNGCSVKSIENIKEDKEHESRSRSSSRSERLSKTSDREGRKSSSRRSQERESKTSQRKSIERESTPRKSSEKKSPEKISERLSRTPPESKSTGEKSSRNESTTDKNAENKSNDEKTSENESTNDKTAETESTNEKTSERESTTEKSSKNKSITDEISENESTNEKTSENESTNEKTSENESTNEKTSENNSTNEKSSENDSTNEKSSERESASRLTAEESQDEKNLEKEPKQISRTDPEETSQTDLKTSTETNPASDQSPEKESGEKRTCKRRGTPENDSVPEKKEKKTGEEETQIKDAEASREEKLKIQERTEDFKRPDQPDSPGDPPRPQTEQLSNSLKPADQLEDSEIREGPHSEPVIGAEELQKPLKPVGTEFVRPVVGYFCNLCQVIYANEDEAKEQHCSSEEHYRKYQEKTRKDPWAS